MTPEEIAVDELDDDDAVAEGWSELVAAKWEREQAMNQRSVLDNAMAHARQIRDKTCDDCAVHDHDEQLQSDCVTLAVEAERLQALQIIVADLTDPERQEKAPILAATYLPAPKRNCPSCDVEMGLYCSHCQQEFEQ